MAAAISGFGTQVQLGDGASPEVFTTIAEAVSISGPSLSCETIDVTNHQSASNHREHIASLRDSGDVSMTINYLPANATHDASTGLLDEWENRTNSNYKIIFPDTGTTTWTFTGVLTGFETSAPIDDKLSADVTIKVTANPTVA